MTVLASEGCRRPVAVQPRGACRRTSEEALRRPPRAGRVVAGPRRTGVACGPRSAARQWRVMVAVAVAVACAVVAFGLLLGGLAHGVAAEVPDRTAIVSIAPGETLWDVAVKFAPHSDPRAVVERIEELNGVSAGAVAPGHALTVPVESRG